MTTMVTEFAAAKVGPMCPIAIEITLLPKVQVDIVVSKVPVRMVVEAAKRVLHTGHIGDGKIFITDVENVVRVRTGEEGYDALQSD